VIFKKSQQARNSKPGTQMDYLNLTKKKLKRKVYEFFDS
jgi:hypothetical protein